VAEVLVVGGGISGLSTAWSLLDRGHSVTLLEADSEPGGTMRTVSESGFLIDLGPNTVLDRTGAVHELAEAVGIGRQIVEANPEAARRYIAKDSQTIPLPSSPGSFLKTPLFTTPGKLRLLLEPFKTRAPDEETVAQFVRRRLGPEFLDWAIDPFVSGVYAGDPERLSVRAATAKIYALEKQYRSLFVGALARAFQRKPSGPTPRGKLLSFRDGMQELPRGLATALAGGFHGNVVATAIERQADIGWRVHTQGGEAYESEQLVLAIPARATAQLLKPLLPDTASALSKITYAPVATVALGFRRDDIEHPLDGFGVLIPRRLGLQTLGCLFSSTLFPERAPQGQVLLTIFIGGARNRGIVERSEDDITDQVIADLTPLLGIRNAPMLRHAHLWTDAIPQYELGHLAVIDSIMQNSARFPTLHLRGNWHGGVSVADCVGSGEGVI